MPLRRALLVKITVAGWVKHVVFVTSSAEAAFWSATNPSNPTNSNPACLPAFTATDKNGGR
jgi:hypothetical protein